MTAVKYADVEGLVKALILSTDIPSKLFQNKVYLAMPKGAPLPTITLARVGGGPDSGSHVPVDVARVSISAWSKNREEAAEIAMKLVSLFDQLGETGGFESAEFGGRLNVGQVLNVIWLPDPTSDIPRYVINVRLTVTTL